MTNDKAAPVLLDDSGWRVWLAIVFLGIGAFTIVTTELAPVGLLSRIASDLSRGEAAVGLSVTLYAWVGAVCALLAAFRFGGVRRKPLLIGLMLVLALSNAAAALAEGFEMLLAARALGAVSHGLFWAVIGACAAQIAPARHTGLATSIVFGGVSAASVLGVPLATLIGQSEGWRWAFGSIGVLSLVTGLGLWFALPAVKPGATTGTAMSAAWQRRDLVGIYVATAFAVTAHFAAFTYIEPFLGAVPGVGASLVAGLLFGFGLAGLLGNVLTGWLIDRYLVVLLLSSLVVISLALIGLGQLGHGLSAGSITVALMLWGLAIAAVFVGFQTWILRSAGAAVAPASALYVAVFNAAIGTGALAGSWLFSHGGTGTVLTVAGLINVGSIAIVGTLGRVAAPPTERLTAA